MQLRNAILIALAFDATPQEVDAARDMIDRAFGGDSSVKPEVLVSANVDPNGNGELIPSHPAVAPAAAAELDKDGLPWDERIHSSSKAKTEKGVWRLKRGLDATLKAKVEAELKAAVGGNAAPAAAAAPPELPAAAPAAPNLPPVPGAAVPDPAYTELVQIIAANLQSPANPTGRINDDWVKQVLTHYQVPDGNLQNAAHMPAVVPEITKYLRSVLV